jgi:hypothetical protein
MQTLTDTLTTAVSNWLTGVLARPFDEERRRAIEFCLAANGADIQLVVRLREGVLVDEGTAEGKRLEIYREDVEPLRPITGSRK